MGKNTEFGCLPTCIGSMPHTDAGRAVSLILKLQPRLPFWPQLPRLSPLEGMCVQYSEGFPGAVVENDKVYVDRGTEFDQALERLYAASEANISDGCGISAGYAAGLYQFLSVKAIDAFMVKGQITGPVSLGLCITDRELRGILYDEVLAEALAKFLRLKAIWQEKALRQVCPKTVIFVDEPSLASLGSAFVAISNDTVSRLLEEVFSGISGLKGIHCCGGAEWPLLLKSSTDVISFDAYNYADSFSLYPAEVKAFLDRGGAVAWGVVPNEEESLARETIASLRDRLEAAIAPFTRNGVRFREVIKHSLVTPSCGLAYLSEEASIRAMELLGGLSAEIRRRYLS